MTRTLYHGNPYTHEEHKRESISQPGMMGLCRWCGTPRRVLYRYDNTKGYFCNKSCQRAYHS